MYSGAYIGRGGFLVARKPPFWPEKWVLLGAGSGAHKVHNSGYYRASDTNGMPGFSVAREGSLHPQLPGYRLRVCT